MDKKLIILVVLISAIIIAALVYFFVPAKKQETTVKPEQKIAETPKEVVKTEVDASKTPDKFPSDIPLEEGATITQNYNATSPDGLFQATRVFETKESLSTNLVIYQEYLENNGYEVKSVVDEASYKMVYGVKDNVSIQVVIDQNSLTDLKTVSINYTESNNTSAIK